MSKSFINRSQNQNTSSNHSNELQKKIDPQAQLDWINNQKVDQGFGVFNTEQSAGNETTQMFTKDEKRKDQGKDAGIQMKKDDIVWPAEIDMNEQVAQAKDAGFGDPMYQSGNIRNEFGDPPVISVNIGCTFGTGGVKLNLNFTIDKKMGDFTASYGFGVTYHSDFYETKKKGFEMRNSLMLDYDTEKFGASLGTNFWNGFGEMKEFDQRTGMVNLRSGKFGLTYENDGFPFQYIGLGDGGDSYRTASASIQMGDFSLNTNLLTGLRSIADIMAEENDTEGGGKMGIPLEGKGKFGETYTHGFVFEQKPQYRYGGLTINYKGTSIGIDSDRWVRHPFQNYLAHDWLNDQRQFEVLSGDIKTVLNGSNLGFSKFTTWGQ
jgi:Bacterial toxin 23